MQKIVFLILLFLSCENKYKRDTADNKKKQGKKESTVSIDGEEYKISGEIDLNKKNEK